MTEKEKKIQDLINGIETSEEIKIRQEIFKSIEFSEKHWYSIYKEELKKKTLPNKSKNDNFTLFI